MYALAESVQVFLYAHNNPASKSFYDQMMMKQRTEAERLAADDRRRRELLLQQRESEVKSVKVLCSECLFVTAAMQSDYISGSTDLQR